MLWHWVVSILIVHVKDKDMNEPQVIYPTQESTSLLDELIGDTTIGTTNEIVFDTNSTVMLLGGLLIVAIIIILVYRYA